MYCVKKVKEDMYWVGGSDRRLALFENVFPVPRGVSYNAYLVLDEKTVLMDTVDKAVSTQFFENLTYLLEGKKLDYLVVNHMEPDHCATLSELVLRYPEVKIVGNSKTMSMIKQFFNFDIDSRALVIKEGDTLNTGRHSFTFAMAPMVHWPEAMVTYDSRDKVLYSADAFGSFGAINGNLFADEVNFESEWLPDARRYYTNIVGKYGPQVTALLKKASQLEIETICPLHGPVWRENIGWFITKYQQWSSYTPEENALMIAYASVYGNTENAANILAGKLADLGVKNIVMYDVSVTHPSQIVSESFRCSHLVFASTTYNGGIFCNMETALHDLQAHNLQNRTVALIENGTWAPMSGKLMGEIFASMKNMQVLEQRATLKSSVKQEQLEQLDALAKAIFASMSDSDTKPIAEEPKEKKGFVCKICGYVYEGDCLPPDFICPICKNGSDSFEPVK
ncbi:MAG: MBL fold metallo-hydrolase [Oscillospiraceae bacterium]